MRGAPHRRARHGRPRWRGPARQRRQGRKQDVEQWEITDFSSSLQATAPGTRTGDSRREPDRSRTSLTFRHLLIVE